MCYGKTKISEKLVREVKMLEKITLFFAFLIISSTQDVEGVRLELNHFEPHCERCVAANSPFNISGRLVLEAAETASSVPTFVLFDILCRQGLGNYYPSIAKDMWITYCYTNFKSCSSHPEQHTNYSEHACACRKLREKVYKIWIRQSAPFLYRMCSFRARMTNDKGFRMFDPSNDTSDVVMSNTVNVADIFKASLYNDTLDKFYEEKNMEDLLNTEAFMGHSIGTRCYGADIVLVFTGVWLLLESLRAI